VFSEVAEQVLEYLGVAHDIEVRPAKAGDKKPSQVTEDDGGQSESDINSLYAAVNELPSDDPLRGGAAGEHQTQAQLANPAQVNVGKTATAKPGVTGAKQATAGIGQARPQAPWSGQTGGGADAAAHMVTVADAGQIRVPSLIGLPIRRVIEAAGAVGLEVNIRGNGTAREQAPAAGTMVAAGTQVVVRAGQ
jgi:cell division protein FtsI (penicillin-binding protein 3)